MKRKISETRRGARPGNTGPRRKLIAFEDETYGALDLLSRDSMKSFQELADEAFRDLLKKHGRTDDLRAALRQSTRQDARAGQTKPNITKVSKAASRSPAKSKSKTAR